MPTYEDLMELANICERRAQAAADSELATVLSKMAMEYQTEAARIENGFFRDVAQRLDLPKTGMATVLIVDDDEQILTLAQSFIQELGHKTLSAAITYEALVVLTGSTAVDALFIDIILNGDMQAGIDFAKRAVTEA